MSDQIQAVPYSFTSKDGQSRIHALLWARPEWVGDDPSQQPRGVIQIVHGMAEHIGRYEHVAQFFVQCGFAVCGEDHIGHGHSVRDEDELGHLPLDGGPDILVGDVHTLYCIMHKAFPEAPYIIYGHSMGSFIARKYLTCHGSDLDACVLSGTGNGPGFLSQIGETLAHLLATAKGEKHRSKFMDDLGVGSYAKAIPNARTSLDWLSTVDSVVDDYMADELSGTMFTVGGYATLLGMLNEVSSKAWAPAVPVDVPILLVAGEEDPVGDKGKGVRAAAQMLRDAGVVKVDEKLYPGLRHELHNEKGAEDILQFIADWIEDVIQ